MVIGVDVSKAKLDVASGSQGAAEVSDNDAKAIRKLTQQNITRPVDTFSCSSAGFLSSSRVLRLALNLRLDNGDFNISEVVTIEIAFGGPNPSGAVDNLVFSTTAIPEPSAVLLLGIGSVCLADRRRTVAA